MDNRRQTIVINKKYQYQHSLLIAAMAVLLVNGFVIARVLFPGQNPLELDLGSAAALAAVEFILITSIWYGSLKASHRTAGPVYVFAREIAKVGTGDLTARISLRKKDMFQVEAESMNTSIAALRSKIIVVKELAEQLQRSQAEGTAASHIAEQLAAEISTFTTTSEK